MSTPTTPPTPRKIEWAGPEGYVVWTDEDGTHLRAPGGHALEMPDIERLVGLWQYARQQAESGAVPAPKSPTREEARADGYRRTEEYAARRALKAIKREFDPLETDTPF
jgi:hypothetical protein